MEIISKRSGPRPEDLRARALIDKNRDTIHKLADQLSGGGYSAGLARKAAAAKTPEAAGLIVSDLKAPRRPSDPKPYVRISPNHRVVVVDEETSRQMIHLGDVRRIDGRWRFVLATSANGFFTPLEPDVAERLATLDGATMGGARTDETLAAEISALMGYDTARG